MKLTFIVLVTTLFLIPAPGVAQPVETEQEGVTAELVELRLSGGVLRLAVRFTNTTGERVSFNPINANDSIVLVDAKSKRKHLPLKDANGHPVAGPISDPNNPFTIQLRVAAKRSTVVWAYFEAVPANTVMTVTMPHVFPFEDVPVTEGLSKAFSSSSATSTPGDGVATLVSARRADQALTVRLRLTSASREVDLVDSYFRFSQVFLFDPVSKRKYPLLKDTSGDLQATPNTVPGAGGSFVFDWRKPTLVSLTFPAPPDTVQRVDLMLPQFVPMEAIAIAGLGGAAESGIATAGTTRGLEGALKDLGARVTDAEIRIDLAADVLFDFDKAEIKKEAEPSLQKLATVIQANPGAKVAIEGHTDGRGADDYNQKLSEARAASVKQWLVTNAKIDGAAISTRGLGRTRPVAPNAKPDGSDDPQGRARNRRVEIVVRK
jgi:outer membrane protein OmpA-like peptidoglycan-associated protein